MVRQDLGDSQIVALGVEEPLPGAPPALGADRCEHVWGGMAASWIRPCACPRGYSGAATLRDLAGLDGRADLEGCWRPAGDGCANTDGGTLHAGGCEAML